jgi:predicted transcriptional regulator
MILQVWHAMDDEQWHTVKELALKTQIESNFVKWSLSRLRTQGVIEVEGDGDEQKYRTKQASIKVDDNIV